MSGWPFWLKIFVVAVPFAVTIAAFSHGVMVAAVPGVLVSGWAFHRAFMSDI
ncbi:hypothetical protein GI374_13915 [Paracoccus sp. S-4012]|uniref:hypothetical protein n=1 Tax=Paracoccus sp. S-4012 TaxID=2665648 RepID=UPI0012AFBE7F|nr:hypothetical protein [Paracoccus sp. S-4012]MRX51516.1 hypothetical protein [Paracoccus sp. S-4012]